MPDNQYDVMIIGGGIIGLATAYYLVDEQRSVCVIEQNEVGAGASHGNCGLLFFSHLLPLCNPGVIGHELPRLFSAKSPLFIAPSLDMARIRWMFQFIDNCRPSRLAHAVEQREKLLSSSKRLYERLLTEESLPCELEKRGILVVCLSESQMEAYVKANDCLKPFGLEASAHVGDALHRLEPALAAHVYGGWYHQTDAHLRPDRLMTALKSLLVQKGVAIIENRRVEHLTADRLKITQAVTSKGSIQADQFVLAAGAWSVELARLINLKLPIQAGKGYSVTMNRPPSCPNIPCYLSDTKVVATPWSSGYRLGGTLEFSGVNHRLRPERIRRLLSAASTYFTEPTDDSSLEQWVGMRSMTPDDLPIIDHTHYKNLLVATGHGTTGLSMATATGKLVSEMVAGREPHIDIRPFSLDRFR